MTDLGGDAIVRATALARHYGVGVARVAALDGVDLCIDHGAMVAFMGPSGSGKSTLLHLIGALDRPSGGALRVAGEDLVGLCARGRARFRQAHVGFLFQDGGLIARLSVLDNVALPLAYRGVGYRARRARAAEMLRAVGLGDRLDHDAAHLSGGEQSRAGVARALVGRPTLLVCDEPTAALDRPTARAVIALLRRAAADGLTVLLSTHDRDLADAADRVLTLDRGRLGAPQTQAQTP
ncbi:hypothetical protein CCR85_13040 [Rhodothalassium salexigens]|uniref:ABC transporter ATP-binding protein n=1 Tax=Rhodothalassium salexigens TaxID=1086 RepID=UPI0019145E3D|nr:ABC transporter ATP-binding protein [Rhodothalassium salexigens]MBK5912411.1 hypothetical protein [Rhodothalassium salexigens]